MQNLHARSRAKPPNVQTRRMSLPVAELRFEGGTDGKPFVFKGYAVKWNSVNQHGEQFVKGAFADLIASVKAGGKKVHMYYNHGYLDPWGSTPSYRIGKWIDLIEDDVGLYVTGELTPNLELADAVGAMLRHGTIDGLSIAFFMLTELDYEWLDGVMIIKRADLYEISVVDEPSDRQARIEVGDQAVEQIDNQRDALDMLQKIGLSPRAAQSLLTRLSQIQTPSNPPATSDSLAFLDSL